VNQDQPEVPESPQDSGPAGKAGSDKRSKKRRIRAAPTVREQAQQRQAKKPRRLRRADKPQKPAGKFRRGFGWLIRHTIPPYIRNSFRELRNVTWPGRKLSLQLTWAVVMFAVVFAVVIGFLDWGLNIAFQKIILRQ
jgi:preprotein translocase SecE subunit